MKRGKKYQDAVKNFDKAAQYDVAEAISLVKKNATAKFDETIELHIRTGCDGRHADPWCGCITTRNRKNC